MMSEEIISSQFDCFFRGDEQNVDGRSTVHAKISFGFVCFLEAIKPARAQQTKNEKETQQKDLN